MAVTRPLTAADIEYLRDKATDRNGVNEIYQKLNNRGYSKHNMDKFYINKIY